MYVSAGVGGMATVLLVLEPNVQSHYFLDTPRKFDTLRHLTVTCISWTHHLRTCVTFSAFFLSSFFIILSSFYLLIAGVGGHCSTWSHSMTHTLSVWLLWTSDQPGTETSIWQHTAFTRDIHAPGRIWTRNSTTRPPGSAHSRLIVKENTTCAWFPLRCTCKVFWGDFRLYH